MGSMPNGAVMFYDRSGVDDSEFADPRVGVDNRVCQHNGSVFDTSVWGYDGGAMDYRRADKAQRNQPFPDLGPHAILSNSHNGEPQSGFKKGERVVVAANHRHPDTFVAKPCAIQHPDRVPTSCASSVYDDLAMSAAANHQKLAVRPRIVNHAGTILSPVGTSRVRSMFML